jgi:DNA-binding response OmpR family regulator
MNERKILVVDDEAPIREMLAKAFGKAGYAVRAVSNGEEALEAFSQKFFPLVYLDLGLETMTGFELCERLREDHPQLVIYALTGYASLFESNEFRDAGFNDFFCKPIKLDALYKSADDAFEKLDRLADEPSPIVIKRILIIDDDDGFRNMLRQMLESEGYEITEAHDGEEGVKCQYAQPADLIITDIVMPKKEGLETICEIQKKYPDVKVIVVSGAGWYGAEVEFDMARILGARTLKKPFKRRALLKTMEEICRQSTPVKKESYQV